MNESILKRNSGIELLKLFAIGSIIMAHVLETLSTKIWCIPINDYVLDLSCATTSVKQFILSILRCGGALGNTIFFVCSAWFLLESTKCNMRKVVYMIMEIWVVSVIILGISFSILGKTIAIRYIFKSLFPTTFSNNWYLTCYIIFYLIHPILNSVIKLLGKKKLFWCCIIMFIMYFCFGMLKADMFFSSILIVWLTIYFIMAYIKFFGTQVLYSNKRNVILLVCGIAMHLGAMLATNLLGLHIPFLKFKLLKWASNCNPFLLMISISLFMLARKLDKKMRAVNYIASFSLLIYIIHENIILSIYFRPYIINDIYLKYGYRHILFWVLIVSIAIFVGALLCSIIYERTIKKVVRKHSGELYVKLSNTKRVLEDKVMKDK